jgi:hypothetical protein
MVLLVLLLLLVVLTRPGRSAVQFGSHLSFASLVRRPGAGWCRPWSLGRDKHVRWNWGLEETRYAGSLEVQAAREHVRLSIKHSR